MWTPFVCNLYKFPWNPFIIISHHVPHSLCWDHRAAWMHQCVHDPQVLGEFLGSLCSVWLRVKNKLLSKAPKIWKTMNSKAGRTTWYSSVIYQRARIIAVVCKWAEAIKKISFCHSCRAGYELGTSLEGAESPQLPLSTNVGGGYWEKLVPFWIKLFEIFQKISDYNNLFYNVSLYTCAKWVYLL